MGDGGVVCMPSLERFPVPEKLCGGNGERTAFLPEKKMRELERRGGGCVPGSAEKGRKVDERSRVGELEKGEFVPDRRRRGESLLEKGEVLESGEFVPDDWNKRELEKGEIVPDKWRKADAERSDSWSGRGRKVVELEKRELIPDKWRKWERERSPGVHQRKEVGGRKELERRSKPPSKVDGGSHDRRQESGSHKHDKSNGKIHGKDGHRKKGTTGSWLKRHSADSLSSSGSKHHDEFTDRSGSKSRRISEDSNASRSEHLEKSSRNSTCVSSKSASTIVRHSSSRHNEPLLPPRGGYDKHGRSPDCNLERSSMHDRARLHDRRNHSPLRPERSPHDSTRHRVVSEQTLGQSDRSPHDRTRLVDLKDRPPGFSGRSPRERPRHREHKDKTPIHLDLSPCERGGSPGRHDLSRRSTERKYDRFEDKNSRRDSSSRCSGRHNLAKQSSDTSSCADKTVEDKPHKEKDLQDHSIDHSEPPPPPALPPPPPPLPPPLVNGVQEELASMEEDMDICDTPPHDVPITDSDMGKWYYLDHFGIERGPSKLMDLKKLVEEGVLLSDHLIKHSDSDRWVTVENAASPLVCLDSHSIVSDAVTQMVSPPQASGNLLSEAEDFCHEIPVSSLNMENDSDKLQFLDNIRIDERVGVLLDGYDILPGKELETIAEALGTVFVHAELENWGRSEGFMRFQHRSSELPRHQRNEEPGLGVDFISKETVETRLVVLSEKEHTFISGDSSDWFAGRWSCKGGDWKRNEDAVQDRSQKRKIVLNEGYPLCQMPKCGYRDPRWQLRDDLYHTSGSKKLDLPPWAFSWLEDKADSSTDQSKNMPVSKSCQARSLSVRGTKGTMLPVVRINACVVKDHGSPSVSETRSRGKSKDRHSSRSTRSYSGGSDRNSVAEGTRTKRSHDYDLHSDHKPRSSINTPSDHVCTRDELALELGDWYYLDGASREHGPYLFSELQDLVAKNTILEHTSVFRKDDNIWVPITTKAVGSKSIQIQEDKGLPAPSHSSSVNLHRDADVFSSFHSSHPHFIGFMCGKLHEFVMKSYKSREFAAAINGVLDPWLNANQPKDLDKQFTFSSSLTKSSSVLGHGLSQDRFWRSEEDHSGVHSHLGKRARMMIDGNNEGYGVEEEILPCQKKDYSFDDLWAEGEGNDASFHPEAESWGLLNCHILARIFHFLRNDLKSLLISAATCKHWKSAVMFYRGVSRYVDFSPTGPNCSDLMFQSIMSGYDYTKVTTIILARCTSVSPSALQEVIRLFPGISTIDIRGCNQFKELIPMFQNVRWIQSQNSYSSRNLEDPYSKARRLKQNWMLKSLKGSCSYLDSFDERGSFGSNGIDMDRCKTFKQGHYSRTKLLDARKYSGALSRNAQLKQLIWKKSENAYRKMEPLITDSLKSIMKDNTSEFLVTKVEEIEDRMTNGYYARHGLSSVKDDIRQMCRNAIKAKKRFNGGDLRQIVTSFLQLAERLEKPKKSYERDGVAKAYMDDSDSGSHSVDSKYKKKQSKGISEKRNMSRNINTSCANGGSDLGGYSFDRNIKKSLSRLNKRHMDSESETSDDDALFEEDAISEGESSGSETESDLDVRSGAGMGNNDGYFMDEAIDTLEEREWGARMTKASLVPPVTRKYEVIDQYLIVADETEVERKMRVALPEDYAEKLHAQSSGVEEMEIPEVKDFKPRKIVGEEVLEQEVYGIDPYTHNLLLDSMTKEMEWPLADMHHFIEVILLRTLNKQVRHFTGSGNAPMVYQLQPVIEEIKRTAEDDGDTRTMKMCYALLKAMRNRSIENYVSYRKGLGVVCNKENGFGEDDFVVEFLGEVYPAWKWYEKQDGIRSLQKNSKEPLPEFYNIYLERPKGDGEGYDLVVVDAMHKANYASRICHSCRPNCEAKVTAVDGHYQIGIYTLRPIAYGEEITFDYNSVTESKDEYEASVCLCGSQVCRGSYLNLTGEEAFQNVLKECHGMLDRHKLMLEACETSCVSPEDYYVLARAGLGSCLLADLPDWLIAYSADLARYINFERTKLPGEIVKHNVEEKMKYIPNYNPEDDKTDAEIQAEGVYNQRLQNMAVTIDKVKYVMRSVYGDPKKAPPPLEKLSPEEVVSVIWRGEGSLIEELLKCLATFMDAEELKNLKSKIRTRDPFGCDDLMMKLRKSLLWLRDQIRDLPCSQKCRNDAAADLLHMYAYTKYFFRVREYKSVTSEPVYISPLDMGPKYMEKMGPGFQEYCKTYGENYCLGQLIYWHNQTNPDPDGSLVKARRGCLSLPNVSSFYASNQKSLRKHIYGAKTLSSMLRRMEKLPQRPWPRDEIWEFKSASKFFGSPMLDAVLNNRPLDSEMMHWLKNRPAMFQGARDG